jgi:hypothetical protein
MRIGDLGRREASPTRAHLQACACTKHNGSNSECYFWLQIDRSDASFPIPMCCFRLHNNTSATFGCSLILVLLVVQYQGVAFGCKKIPAELVTLALIARSLCAFLGCRINAGQA